MQICRERERASESERARESVRETKFIRNYCMAGVQARRVPGEWESACLTRHFSSVTRTGRRFGM
jgi:hypothetical protein